LLRKKIRGWSKNINEEIRKKAALLSEIDLLDLIVGHQALTDQEKNRRKAIGLELDNI
jgi:hypothetical protein